MNDFEKAKTFLCDKNNSLTMISKKTGISYSRLSVYRAEPSKLERAIWINVHKLAQLYDAKH